ncbi:MAG: c-type cytochrome domain-containing protein [Verrucomicrobiales bacterium]
MFFVFATVFLDASATPPEFYADVVPILRDYCVGCHNEDDYEGDFSVETFRALMEGGESGWAVEAGDGHGSLLVETLTGRSKPRMPPKKEPKPEAGEIAILKAWIDAGAWGPKGKDESMLANLHVPEIAPGAGAPRPVTAVAYSPDGGKLAVARYRSVEVRDAGVGKRLFVLGRHPGKINAVHFSPDGKSIVTASGITGLRGVAMLWDAATGKALGELGAGHRDILYDAEFSPDGTLLATAGYDRRIILWKVATGEEIRRIEVHNGAVFDLASSPDGATLASGSADDTVKLWKVSTGERLDTLKEPEDEQYSVAFTPDGKFVLAAGADKCIRMWRLLSRDQPKINPLVRFRMAHEEEIVALALTADGSMLVSSSADHSLKTWSLPALDPGRVYRGQADLVAALAVAPDGRSLLAARMDGSLQKYALESHSPAGQSPVVGEESAAAGEVVFVQRPEATAITEAEPNDLVEEAAAIVLPAEIKGTVGRAGDVDIFSFRAAAGEEWVLEVDAARSKSPLDSKIEVLDAEGRPVERVVLRAVQDSWFTFRGKNSDVVNDFRLQNWREMEVNEYLYANGEVVKLWLSPRGPDSGFNVYPGFGKRHTYFGTSALAHPMGEPVYIVRPLPAGAQPSSNGLPVFRLYYENDDEPRRRWGDDSYILFTAPADGEYHARLRDVRGFGGKDFSYLLKVRPRKPDFEITLKAKDLKISPGSGKEFTLSVERKDDFVGEIRVDVLGLPEGFTASTPVVIERGQHMAVGVINAAPDALAPDALAAKAAVLTARATVQGREVSREIGGLGEIALGEPAKVIVEILPQAGAENVVAEQGKPIEFTIAPGETISARVVATRVDFEERIQLGKEDSGRNLPHGVYVDNIGLSGLLIVPGQNERQFFLSASKWVPESTRYFHLATSANGGQASLPVILHVRKPTVGSR